MSDNVAPESVQTPDSEPEQAPANAIQPAQTATGTTPDLKAIEEAKARRVALIDWLMNLDSSVREGHILVSRPNEMYLWQQTGFMIEGGKVYGKYGNAHYQPIGRDDGEGYYPTQGAAVLWSHDYAIASVKAIAGPFTVSRKEVIIDVSEATDTALSDKERDAMMAALKQLQANQATFQRAETDEDKTKIRQTMVDDVRLFSFQIARLDKALTDLAEKNPEFKRDLTGIDPVSLTNACVEYLRMKLNDDAIQRYNRECTIEASAGNAQTILERCMTRISEAMPVQGKECNEVTLREALEAIMVIYPASVAVLAPFMGTTNLVEAAGEALKFLQGEKDKLATPPAM